jgi:hypothetical protein
LALLLLDNCIACHSSIFDIAYPFCISSISYWRKLFVHMCIQLISSNNVNVVCNLVIFISTIEVKEWFIVAILISL